MIMKALKRINWVFVDDTGEAIRGEPSIVIRKAERLQNRPPIGYVEYEKYEGKPGSHFVQLYRYSPLEIVGLDIHNIPESLDVSILRGSNRGPDNRRHPRYRNWIEWDYDFVNDIRYNPVKAYEIVSERIRTGTLHHATRAECYSKPRK